MENPEHEIRNVVRSLCQGTAAEQRRALERYFTKDASFVHPFCTVPHFGGSQIPLLNRLNSRDVVRSIFQWYRMLSPKIEIEIDSALHDQARDKIYLDMRQTFSIWFIPLYHAHVRLVTVLDLVASDGHDYHDPLNRILSYEEGEGGTNGNSGHQHHNGSQGINHHDQRHNNNGGHHQHNGSRNGTNGHHHHHGSRTWKISKQEDLYQVNDFLRFMGGPGPFPFLWYLFQLSATAVCIFMSLFLSVSPWALQKEPARGGVEATIECVDDSGPDSPSSYHDVKQGENDDNNNNNGSSKTGGGDSTTGGDPYAVGGGGSHIHDSHGTGSSGHANDTNGHHEHNGHNGHNHNNNHGHNGHRRGSSTSKTSHSSAPKKSWKNGGKRKSKDAAAAAAAAAAT